MRKSIHAVIVFALLCATAFAGDVAVLRNGFTINHKHRETIGNITRLYLDDDERTYVDIPTADIERIDSNSYVHDAANQQVPDPPPPPPAPTQVVLPIPVVATQPSNDVSMLVRSASREFQLDPDLVDSVIRYESNGNARAISTKGARGLMQLMPGTARELGVSNAFNPQQNIEAGTRYLRSLLEQFNFDLVKALAAYNAGPIAVQKYNGVPPYRETHQYVANIVKDFNKKKRAEQAAKKKTPAKVASNTTVLASTTMQ